ncbi:hypothetical protein RHOW815_000393 [Candidatus Rhabdochlamydia sp. W815]|nr:hypothetical protein RHOW815_000393 [Candidatus Rhabdochlamydia sp. W815]
MLKRFLHRTNGFYVVNRKEKTSFVIIDAQSVKNTDTSEKKGYDAEKKISGIKRHIAFDTQGLPHAIHITTANILKRIRKKTFQTLNSLNFSH